MIINLLRRAARRLGRDDHGFTMVAVMGAMLVLGTFTAAAWSAANGDLPIARGDQNRKSALEAAEAGIQWYTHQLEQSTNFWSTCTPTTQGVNMKGSRTSLRTVSGSTAVDKEQFAIEVMPAPGKTSTRPSSTRRCSTTACCGSARRARSATARARSWRASAVTASWTSSGTRCARPRRRPPTTARARRRAGSRATATRSARSAPTATATTSATSSTSSRATTSRARCTPRTTRSPTRAARARPSAVTAATRSRSPARAPRPRRRSGRTAAAATPSPAR